MHHNDNVRNAAKELVVAFAHHLRDKINNKDTLYINTGLDEDFLIYEDIFKSVLSKLLGVSIRPTCFIPNRVLEETREVLLNVVAEKHLEDIVSSNVHSHITYEVCLFVLRKFQEEEHCSNLVMRGE